MQETQHPSNTVLGGAERGPTGGRLRAQTLQRVPGLSTACKPSHLSEPWAQASSHKLLESREKRNKGQKLERLDFKHHLLDVPFFLMPLTAGCTRPKTREYVRANKHHSPPEDTHPQDDSCMGGTELEWPQRRSCRMPEAPTTLRGGRAGSWLRA